MQVLTIECDFCERKFKLIFPKNESDPIVCPFCATGLEQELLLDDEDRKEEE